MKKIAFIEQLRGVALLLVLAYHYTDRIPYSIMGSPEAPSLMFYTGKIGVYLFFIISGYLIAKTIESSSNLAEFYAKRLSRIWPLFLLANLVVFLYAQYFITPVVPDGVKDFDVSGRTWLDLIGTSFFLEDLGFQWVDGVYWSILVELKYYFYVGIFAALFKKNFAKYFILFSLSMGILDLFIAAFFHAEEYRILNKILHGLLIAQYLPYFAIGMALYKKYYDLPLLVCCLLATCQLIFVASYNPDFDMNMTLKFGVAFCVFVAIDHYLFKGKVLNIVGHYSYSLYLFHQVIGLSLIMYFIPFVGINLAILLAFVIVFAFSALASWLVEWRYRRALTTFMLNAFSKLKINKIELKLEEKA